MEYDATYPLKFGDLTRKQLASKEHIFILVFWALHKPSDPGVIANMFILVWGMHLMTPQKLGQKHWRRTHTPMNSLLYPPRTPTTRLLHVWYSKLCCSYSYLHGDVQWCAHMHVYECVLPCLFALMCLQKILLSLHGGDRPISTQVAVQLSEPNKMAEAGPDLGPAGWLQLAYHSYLGWPCSFQL